MSALSSPVERSKLGLHTIEQYEPLIGSAAAERIARKADRVRAMRIVGTVYHGLPLKLCEPSFDRGSYLAFLGRLTPEKGPEAAIRIAKAVGMPLRIAAKVPRGERGYFKERLEPQVDGKRIQLTGEVNDEAKRRFSCRGHGAAFSNRLA